MTRQELAEKVNLAYDQYFDAIQELGTAEGIMPPSAALGRGRSRHGGARQGTMGRVPDGAAAPQPGLFGRHRGEAREELRMSDVRPIHEVFLPVAQDIAFLTRGRGIYRFEHIKRNEPFKAFAYPQDDGTTRLVYQRVNEHDGDVELYVAAGDTAHVTYGDEHILSSENLPSVSEVVDVRNHDADVEVNFRDLFGQSESDSNTDSGGASVKVSIESEQDIEGFAKFKESRSRLRPTQSSRETQGTESSQEQEGEEGTLVHAGKRARITETRMRADGEVEITADGHFVISKVSVGKHSGGKFVGGQQWPLALH